MVTCSRLSVCLSVGFVEFAMSAACISKQFENLNAHLSVHVGFLVKERHSAMLTAISVDSRWKHAPSLHSFFSAVVVVFVVLASSMLSALLHWIALHLHSYQQRERAREKECVIVAAFSSWLLLVPFYQRIAVEKQRPSSVVCLFVLQQDVLLFLRHILALSLSLSLSHHHQFHATIHPYIHPSIHTFVRSFIYPSVSLNVSLSLWCLSASITMYHATHVFSLALYVGVKSLTCASITTPFLFSVLSFILYPECPCTLARSWMWPQRVCFCFASINMYSSKWNLT